MKRVIFAIALLIVGLSTQAAAEVFGNLPYVVQNGQAFERILRSVQGDDFHITNVTEVAEANGIENPNLIYPGQVINIPVRLQETGEVSFSKDNLNQPTTSNIDTILQNEEVVRLQQLLDETTRRAEDAGRLAATRGDALRTAEEKEVQQDNTIATLEEKLTLSRANEASFWGLNIWFWLFVPSLITIVLGFMFWPNRKALDGTLQAQEWQRSRLSTQGGENMFPREILEDGVELRKVQLEPPLYTESGKVPRVTVKDGLVSCVVSGNRPVQFDNYPGHLEKCAKCRDHHGVMVAPGWHGNAASQALPAALVL